jgi:elongation factor Ts
MSLLLRRSGAVSLPRGLLSAPRALVSSRATLIKELRARTSAPMKKCVEALAEAGDDIEQAVTLLRKAGLAAAQKKASRGATEGAVAVFHAPNAAALIELNSETDFVARNELFQALASGVARTALGMDAGAGADAPPQSVLDTAIIGEATLVQADGDAAASPSTVTEALGFGVSQLGENLVLRRAALLRAPEAGGVVGSYVHNSYSAGVGRTAAAVVLRSDAADTDALRQLGQQLSMHVVAAAPQFLSRESVDEAAVQRERDILLEQARQSGKPDNVIEKMVDGRLKKFYSEVCLLEQSYLIDEGAGSVSKVLAAAGERLGAPVELSAYVRYQVGEESGAPEE